MPPSSEHRGRGNPNVEPLAQEHVIAAQVPDHTRFFFHDPNLARLTDGRLIIAAPQWGRSRTPDAGTRHLRILLSDDGGTTWDEAPALPYQEGRPFILDGRLLMFVQEESHRDFLLVGSDDAPRCRRRSSAARSQGEATANAVPGASTRPFAWLEPNTVEVAGHIRVFVRCTIRSQAMAHVAAALEYDADLCTIHRVRDFRSLAMDLHAGGLHRTASREVRQP